MLVAELASLSHPSYYAQGEADSGNLVRAPLGAVDVFSPCRVSARGAAVVTKRCNRVAIAPEGGVDGSLNLAQ